MTTYKDRLFNTAENKLERKTLRNNTTEAERSLWQFIKNKQVEGLKFRRQHGIGNYIMDFYCPKIKLCIELDGGIHDTSEMYENDMARTIFLNDNGITVMRYSNEVVFMNTQIIIESIKNFNKDPHLVKGWIKDILWKNEIRKE